MEKNNKIQDFFYRNNCEKNSLKKDMTQYTNVLDIVLHVFKIQNYNIMK